jgi:hypothetical protein
LPVVAARRRRCRCRCRCRSTGQGVEGYNWIMVLMFGLDCSCGKISHHVEIRFGSRWAQVQRRFTQYGRSCWWGRQDAVMGPIPSDPLGAGGRVQCGSGRWIAELCRSGKRAIGRGSSQKVNKPDGVGPTHVTPRVTVVTKDPLLVGSSRASSPSRGETRVSLIPFPIHSARNSTESFFEMRDQPAIFFLVF